MCVWQKAQLATLTACRRRRPCSMREMYMGPPVAACRRWIGDRPRPRPCAQMRHTDTGGGRARASGGGGRTLRDDTTRRIPRSSGGLATRGIAALAVRVGRVAVLLQVAALRAVAATTATVSPSAPPTCRTSLICSRACTPARRSSTSVPCALPSGGDEVRCDALPPPPPSPRRTMASIVLSLKYAKSLCGLRRTQCHSSHVGVGQDLAHINSLRRERSRACTSVYVARHERVRGATISVPLSVGALRVTQALINRRRQAHGAMRHNFIAARS